MVCPFNRNFRVKWDPDLKEAPPKFSGEHGGDVMPKDPHLRLMKKTLQKKLHIRRFPKMMLLF